MNKPATHPQPIGGYIFASLGVLLFSLKPIFVKLAYEHDIDSTTLMALRMSFSLPIYLAIGVWLVLKNKVPQFDSASLLPRAFLVGILGYYGASYLDLTALQFISAQLERLILYAYPSLVVIIGYFLLGTAIEKGTIPALLFTYLGIGTLFVHDLQIGEENLLLGSSLVFASAVLFAFYIILSKSLITKMSSMVFTCVAMCAASIAIVIHFLVEHNVTDLFDQAIPVYMISLAIALFSTVLPSFFISEAIHRIGSNSTSIIGSSGAVVTSILAVLILGEAFTRYHVIALILVTSGIIWLGRKK